MFSHWRDDNPKTLLDLAGEAEARGYTHFAEYCRLREQGLREKAFGKLEEFIPGAKQQPPGWRRDFSDWLLSFCFYSMLFEACPSPLKRDLIAPTIEEWAAQEPSNAKALRWHPDLRAVLIAARSTPPDEIAVGLYANRVLNHVDYSCHELRAGSAYLGESMEQDLADIQVVIDLLNTVPNARFFHPLREEALGLKHLLLKKLS